MGLSAARLTERRQVGTVLVYGAQSDAASQRVGVRMGATDLRSHQRLRITLPDVARLAQVQRPVVSMWRTRCADSDDPFPPPVDVVDRVEQFDAEAVGAWLERTGRGNNPDVRNDLAAFSRPTGASSLGDDSYVRAVTALLCLKVVTGAQLTGLEPNDLVHLADDADPSDTYLSREIAGLGADASAVAAYTDSLADAAYSPARAFELLMADRFRQRRQGHTQTALREDARQLVARVAQGLAQAVDLQPPVFVDPTCGGSDLLIEVAALYADGPAPTVMTSDDDADICRLVRRRLRVHDLHREPLRVDADGAFEVSGQAVHIAQFPSAGAPAMTDIDILSAIDSIVLQMDERQLAVVVAPAGILTDRLASAECEAIRDGLLRSDRVRATLRLPKGVLVNASRQPLALWALGPAHPDVHVGDRWTVVGDVGDRKLDDAAIDDIVTDVVAAMGDRSFVRAHAFRFARRVNTGSLLAGRGALLARVATVRKPVARTGADIAVRVGELTGSVALTDDAGSPTLVVEAAEHDDAKPMATLTLGQAVELRAVRLVPGNRVDEDHLHAESGARVIGPEELAGVLPWGGRFVDRLVLAGTYKAGRLTLPGDVVFCTSPRAVARVDIEGGSVVLSPARVLRSSDVDRADRVVPEVLAADINAVPARETQWRFWQVRRTPKDQAQPLVESLLAIERERAAAKSRLAQLDELADLVTDGVTSRSVTVRLRPQQRSGDPPATTATDQRPPAQSRQKGR